MRHLLHHLFLPRHTNNHRARALHIDALLVYVLAFVVFNLGFRFVYRQYPDVLGYATDIRVEQLLASTNAKRQAAGLSPLSLNRTLSAAAAGKAQDMFAKNYWAHVAPDGTTPWDFIMGSGYRYTVAGENLAKNFSTSGGVVDAWMASQSHRDNILKSGYRDVGFAVVNGVLGGEETTLVVQMFGSTSQLATAPTQPTPKPEVVKLPVNQPANSVVIPETASQTRGTQNALPLSFIASYQHPLFDLPTVTRVLAFAFGGFLIILLIVDFWVATRRRTVRVSGHTIAHILFFITIFFGMSAIFQGAIL